MSRTDRLKEYANPRAGAQGAASDKRNLDFWSKRASENSKVAPRAKGGKVSDARAAAKADLNTSGSSYMRGIRRDA